MKLSKNSGFSLIEIMLAAAALGGLALVGMQMTKTQFKSSTKASFDSETNLITNEIVAILSSPVKCATTLVGKSALSTVAGINAIDTNKYYSIASGTAPANGYGNLNLQIQNYALSATNAEVGANNSFLLINYQNKNILKGSSGPSTITKKIKLYAEVDAGNNITRCRSLSSSSADIWTRGSASAIYYNGGNVGIGTAAPAAPLHVIGIGARIDRNSGGFGGIDFYNGATAEGTVRFSNDRMTFEVGGAGNAFEKMRITPAGNVGIGTMTPNWPLTVGNSVEGNAFGVGTSGDIIVSGGTDRNWALYKTDAGGAPQTIVGINPANTDFSISAKLNVTGGIHPGSSAAVTVCGLGQANGEGTQRYNYTSHVMEYCNGVSWASVGSNGCRIDSCYVLHASGAGTCATLGRVFTGGLDTGAYNDSTHWMCSKILCDGLPQNTSTIVACP